RSDLLGLRMDGDDLIVDTIEVKTCGGSNVEVPRAELDKACGQLAATLEAVRSGLRESEGDGEEISPLGAPRQEMLKEVFVAGCQSLTATAEDRERWAGWLKSLFGEGIGAGGPRLGGLIYAVELGNNSVVEETVLSPAPDMIIVRKIRE